MKTVYRVLAYVVALGVVVQAAAIAYAAFGLFKWVENGGTLDKSVIESEDPQIGGLTGFVVHGMNGTMILPIIVLLFLVVSFFAKVPGGIKWALIVLGTTVVQVALGLFSHSVAGLGWLHGAVALVLFGVAVTAGARAGRAAEVDERVAVPVA